MQKEIEGIFPQVRSFESGCDYHRIVLPFAHCGYDFSQQKIPVEKVRAIVFNRQSVTPIDVLFEARKKYGIGVIVDMDDSTELNAHHYLNGNYNSALYKAYLKNSDAVTCTTERLRQQLLQYNKNVYVIPNALPYDIEGTQFVDSRKELEFKTVFGYVGGVSHREDMLLLRNTMSRFANECNKNNTSFVLCGYNSQNYKSKAIWDSMERSFTGSYKVPNYIRLNSKPVAEYMQLYSNFNVALVPLEDNIFNQYKSPLKILEAGVNYQAAICSDVIALNYNFNKEKSGVMFAKNSADWLRWMRYCERNPDFVYDSGQRLGEYVRKHFHLSNWNNYRLSVYEKIINSPK